jgi:hypothetical protein
MMGLEAKSISVRFREGEVLDESLVREQVRESSGWQAVTVAPSRKTVDLGPHKFKAKSVGWKLSSEGRGTISGGNYEGFSESSSSDPEIKLNLTTPWVFFVQKEALSDLENGATGTLLFLRSIGASTEQRAQFLEDFFYDFGSFSTTIYEKYKDSKASEAGGEDSHDGSNPVRKNSSFVSKIFGKKNKTIATPADTQPDVTDHGW